jgi:hypothetical protein
LSEGEAKGREERAGRLIDFASIERREVIPFTAAFLDLVEKKLGDVLIHGVKARNLRNLKESR